MRKFVIVIGILAAMLGFAIVPVSAQAPTIADIVIDQATNNGEFEILLAAVLAADPAIVAALSDPTQDLTVFAPTDAAFEKLLGQLGLTADQLLANTALLNDVLLYHVLPQSCEARQLIRFARAGWPRDYQLTLQGTYVELTLDGRALIVDSSWVSAANIFASNGVVHVIDTVLLPSFNFGEEGLPHIGFVSPRCP